MQILKTSEVLWLHACLVGESGGSLCVRGFGGLESALAQPFQTFAGSDLYPILHEKAAALACSLAKNHPFVDGNKRIAHAAMETFFS